MKNKFPVVSFTIVREEQIDARGITFVSVGKSQEHQALVTMHDIRVDINYEEEATVLYEWLGTNLPYHTYDYLCSLMSKKLVSGG